MEQAWRWTLGMVYVIAVAVIWIAASFVVQSVVDAGVSPFLITYICNSLFVIYIPIVEGGQLLRRKWEQQQQQDEAGPEKETLLLEAVNSCNSPPRDGLIGKDFDQTEGVPEAEEERTQEVTIANEQSVVASVVELTGSRVWSRGDIARVGLLICPFWFVAQFTFNLSLKYTTVTSNTILSSTSSLFTFLVSLGFLGEKFTWLKLSSVLLCMAGTVMVGLADTTQGMGAVHNAGWGDTLCLLSALVYAIYTTLLRKQLPDETAGEGKASTALFFGYLGLFNGLLLGPLALILHFSGIESFHHLSPSQWGLILGKGLLDNVLSDYLWAKAVLLTTPTAATAGLTIQVPIAAVVDSLRGKIPSRLNLLGAVAVLLGFFGINQPATGCCGQPAEESSEFESVKHETTLDVRT